MLYLHDVWVNWFEGEENGYNVCPFHEWRKSDGIEILDQAPILFIDDKTFEYIENDLQDIPQSMLDQIYQRAYIRKNQEREQLDYACIITDGFSVLAFDTMGYHIPIRKSRLIPRQERLVYDLIKGRTAKSYSLPTHIDKEFHILSLPPEYMVGLTRRERQLKQLLMIAMDQLEVGNRLEEIRYWLTEWAPEQYHTIKKMTFKEAWEKLYQDLVIGWSSKHENFCEQIIKGQAFYEDIWEREQQPYSTKSLRS
ncbi:YjbA family protein [Gracilibacillus sp. HCP3S3_G5_1]|uniref:YjbA family protein n=1 Tax=unclassified Gracilibacillus TaxID=2625209 RepID=UPI003F8BFE18